MKKVYILFLLAAFTSASAFAQVVTGCKLATKNGVRITYDDNKSCKGDLKALAAISMHGGINGWKNVVDADKSTLTINGKGGVFTFEITNPAAYFNTLDPIDRYDFVFNQFATVKDAAKMWEKEGKDKNAAGDCADMFLEVAKLKACTSNTNDLLLDTKVTVAPNPAMDKAVVTIAGNGVYTVELTTVTGQLLSATQNVTGSTTIERNNMAAGMYYVVIRNAEGKFQAQRVIFE